MKLINQQDANDTDGTIYENMTCNWQKISDLFLKTLIYIHIK